MDFYTGEDLNLEQSCVMNFCGIDILLSASGMTTVAVIDFAETRIEWREVAA
ncbi:hypothetical protein [Burkholderia sp. BE12]|uniref:hypothetical protein n=1 Tax=Burkholderia sp. BE12 TaxID=2082394 RepID=UPI00131A45B8|nr:hypothetical protein [Burkholderia sp. BE12]